jgi:hypothetical protein
VGQASGSALSFPEEILIVNRYQALVVTASLLCAGSRCLIAQSNTAEVFGGYSYAKINPEANLPKENAHGWMGGAAGYANRWVGAGFEIAGHFGNISAPGGAPDIGFKEYSYMAGPQFRFLNTAKAQAGVKVLLGGVFGQVRLSDSTTPAQAQALGAAGYANFDQTKFAMMVGFPFDVTVTRIVGIRVEPGWFRTSFMNDHQSNFRISLGPVFRFGSH